MKLLACKFIMLAAILWTQSAAAGGAFRTDEQGRKLRYRFDRSNRFEFGFAYRPTVTGAGQGAIFEHSSLLKLGFFHSKSLVPAGRLKRTSHWQLYHEALSFELLLSSRGKDGPRRPLTARLFAGSYLRYFEKPFLIIPGKKPTVIRLPFNVGFRFELGELHYDPRGVFPVRDITLVRGFFLLDFLRSSDRRNYLHVGFGFSYALLERNAPGSAGDRIFRHGGAPFTAGLIRFRAATANEHHVLFADLRAEPLLISSLGWRTRCAARMRFDTVVLAINDQPLTLFVSLSYRFDDTLGRGHDRHEFSASFGVSLNFLHGQPR